MINNTKYFIEAKIEINKYALESKYNSQVEPILIITQNSIEIATIQMIGVNRFLSSDGAKFICSGSNVYLEFNINNVLSVNGETADISPTMIKAQFSSIFNS